jgi:hypothetical protein
MNEEAEFRSEGCKYNIDFVCLETINMGCIMYNTLIGVIIILACIYPLSSVFYMDRVSYTGCGQ